MKPFFVYHHSSFLHHNFTRDIDVVSCPFEEVSAIVHQYGQLPREVFVTVIIGCLGDVFSVDVVECNGVFTSW